VLLALIAIYSIARTLAAPDGPVQNSAPIGADFAVPSYVIALQGTSSLDTVTRIGEGVRLTGWIFDQRTNLPGQIPVRMSARRFTHPHSMRSDSTLSSGATLQQPERIASDWGCARPKALSNPSAGIRSTFLSDCSPRL
jgi:hypothetical protein